MKALWQFFYWQIVVVECNVLSYETDSCWRSFMKNTDKQNNEQHKMRWFSITVPHKVVLECFLRKKASCFFSLEVAQRLLSLPETVFWLSWTNVLYNFLKHSSKKNLHFRVHFRRQISFAGVEKTGIWLLSYCQVIQEPAHRTVRCVQYLQFVKHVEQNTKIGHEVFRKKRDDIKVPDF